MKNENISIIIKIGTASRHECGTLPIYFLWGFWQKKQLTTEKKTILLWLCCISVLTHSCMKERNDSGNVLRIIILSGSLCMGLGWEVAVIKFMIFQKYTVFHP